MAAALRLAVLALAGAASSSAFSTSTSYCYDNDPFPDDCWANKPTTTVPCTATSGTTTCKCADEGDSANIRCNIGLTGGTTGRCEELMVYVGGEQAELRDIGVGVSATSTERFCKSMVLNDQWDELGLVATDDNPESRDKGWFTWWWYGCPRGYTEDSWWGPFSDGPCYREERLLGERCWQAWGTKGTCGGSDTSYDEYSTSCYRGTCVPYAEVETRDSCECSWVGLNLFVVCSAADDACDGHACVWNTGDGNHYCDYATSQDWQTLFSR